MGSGLTVKKEGLVSAIHEKGLANIIEPLKREIFLFDSYIAGTTHLDDKSVLELMQVDDQLILQRENNKFDSAAILLLNKDKKKLGYIPEKDNVVFSRLMDAGKLLTAKITDINTDRGYYRVKIAIFLVDF